MKKQEKFWTRKHTCFLVTNTAVSVIPNSLCSICLLFLICFSGESFHETLAWQREFCNTVTYGKTRERDMEFDGVSVATGWCALFLLGEQGFGKSLALGRTSETYTLDSQSIILLFYIFSMQLQNAFWFVLVFFSLDTEAARLRISAECSHYWISLADTFTIDSWEIFTWSHKALNWSGMRFWGSLEDKDSIISTFLYSFQPKGWSVPSAAFHQPGWDWTGCTGPWGEHWGKKLVENMKFIFFFVALVSTDRNVMHI